MNDRDIEWICFPADLYFSKTISFQEKAFLIEVRGLSRRDPVRGCHAQNRHFAEQFNLSISRVSEVFSDLERKGLVRITFQREGKKIVERNVFLTDLANAFWTSPTPSGKEMNPFGKGDEPPSGKAKEKSTIGKDTKEESDERFDACWQAFPHVKARSSKKASLAAFKGLSEKHKSALLDAITAYTESLKPRDREFVPAMERWLRGGKHRDFITEPVAPIDVKDEWDRRLIQFKEKGIWLGAWGEKPTRQTCEIPIELLRKYGFRPPAEQPLLNGAKQGELL